VIDRFVLRGAWATLAKYTLGYFPTGVMLSLRWSLSALLLIAVMVVRERALPRMLSVPLLWRVALLALIGVVLQQTFFMIGLRRTTAINTAILQMITPPVTTFFSLLLRIEKIMWEKILGVSLAVVGTVVFLDVTKLDLSDGVVGNLLVCCASAASAFYLLWGRPLWSDIGSLTVTAWSFLITYESERRAHGIHRAE